MSQLPLAPSAHASVGSLKLADLDRTLARSTTCACCISMGLPTLGILSSLIFGLSLFAALMTGCVLLATALTCNRALTTFTSKALRLLVTARLVVLLIVGALLACAQGSAWTGIVSAVLLWLLADRLLGRNALSDLRKPTRTKS